jgi:predicted RNA binding protein YcfA (HicA-like mRNA interferase family)
LPELPVVSGRDARRAFERDGWVFRRQAGSHMILTKAGSIVSLSIRTTASWHRARCAS